MYTHTNNATTHTNTRIKIDSSNSSTVLTW